jgi:hypothetical protein
MMVVAMLIVLAAGVALYVVQQHLYSKRMPPGVKPLPGPIGEYLVPSHGYTEVQSHSPTRTPLRPALHRTGP